MILVAAGVVGLSAVALISSVSGRQLRPYRADLSLSNQGFTSPPITLTPGYRYRLAVGGDGAVDYADCLLGAGAAGQPCDGHPAVLRVSWSLREDGGQLVAAGVSPNKESSFQYGRNIEGDLGYFSVFRSTSARLTFRYRVNPAPLSDLHPYVVIDAPEALLWFGASETLAGVLFATLACIGAGRLLLTTWRRREHPAWVD